MCNGDYWGKVLFLDFSRHMHVEANFYFVLQERQSLVSCNLYDLSSMICLKVWSYLKVFKTIPGFRTLVCFSVLKELTKYSNIKNFL